MLITAPTSAIKFKLCAWVCLCLCTKTNWNAHTILGDGFLIKIEK